MARWPAAPILFSSDNSYLCGPLCSRETGASFTVACFGRFPERRRARFGLLSPLARSCHIPVNITTVQWLIGAVRKRTPPEAGLKAISSPIGCFSESYLHELSQTTGLFLAS
jgi:hypothetical protein